MEEDVNVAEAQAQFERIGDRLRAAREAKDLSLEQVAAETRIPLRHLETIEAGNFTGLPSRTYAIGFSRTYARMLDLDEREVIDAVRAELAEGSAMASEKPARFEPGDPARVPGRGLAWFALLAAVLLIGGIYAFYRSYFSPGLGPAPLEDPAAQIAENGDAGGAPKAQPAPQPTGGPVVFTSTEDEGTWVRFYDGEGERLYEGVLAKGQTFTVPADAKNPQIRTGRPYGFTITVGGKPVPKLSEVDEVISDVPVSAEALLARGAPAAAPATPAPATSAASTAPAGT